MPLLIPESAYIDDAHFELGRSYERDGNYAEAKKEYQILIDKFRESILYPKALLQMGLVNYNISDYQNSLKYYKQVAENFGGTQEAQAALMGIKNCYIELNDVDAYFSYANKLGTGTIVTASEQDSLTYLAAEKQFMANDPNASNQLRQYLQQFPDGSFILNASFYLGEALIQPGENIRNHLKITCMLHVNLSMFSVNLHLSKPPNCFTTLRGMQKHLNCSTIWRRHPAIS